MTEPDDTGSRATPARALPDPLAIALVAGTSGAVLVLEILAGRVMAPYVGVDLETYTAVIGTILAGIALGAGVGGSLADRRDPRRLIPVLLMFGGALAISSVPIVRALGGAAAANAPGLPTVLMASMGFLPSAAALSAIPPCVVKLQLGNLDETGGLVGRLSAWGTVGAIVGTFLAGFVLVAYAAVSTLIVIIGCALVLAGALLWFGLHRSMSAGIPSEMLMAGGLVAFSVSGLLVVDQPCDVQTGYYCVSVRTDPVRTDGRVLVLDDLRHSYVALDDPMHLEFWYIRQIVGAIDALAPSGRLDVLALGAGAFTVPRYLATTRPDSALTVLEIDPDLIEIVEREFAVDTDRYRIVTGDARRSLRDLPDASADVVIGDAFGSRAVPWHLATEEFMREIARVLRPGGLYVANIIDGPSQSFLRAESATIRTALPSVAVMPGDGLGNGSSGNAVVVASDRPFDAAAWDLARSRRGDTGALVVDTEGYLDGALTLTDDFAPVDQLIAGTR